MAVGPRPRAADRQIFPARDAAHRQRPRVAVVAAEQADADERLVTGWAGRHGLRAGAQPADAAEAGRGGQPGGFLEKIATGGEGDRYVAPPDSRALAHGNSRAAPAHSDHRFETPARSPRSATRGKAANKNPKTEFDVSGVRLLRVNGQTRWFVGATEPPTARTNATALRRAPLSRPALAVRTSSRASASSRIARTPPSGRRARRRRCSQRRPRGARCKPESDCSSPAPGCGASK